MRITVKTPTLTSYKIFENFCKLYGIFFSLGPRTFLYLFTHNVQKQHARKNRPRCPLEQPFTTPMYFPTNNALPTAPTGSRPPASEAGMTVEDQGAASTLPSPTSWLPGSRSLKDVIANVPNRQVPI